MALFEVGSKQYEIELHGIGYGGPRYAALNVKYSGTPQLPKKYWYKYTRMREAAWLVDDHMEEAAISTIREDWWNWAQDLAKEYDLGKIYSAGRCGGWLVLDRYSEQSLESLAEDASSCSECGKPYAEHAKEHCLFEPTMFSTNNPGGIETFDTIKKFFDECSQSLATYVPAEHAYQLREHIDVNWADYQLQKRGERGRKTRMETVDETR